MSVDIRAKENYREDREKNELALWLIVDFFLEYEACQKHKASVFEG